MIKDLERAHKTTCFEAYTSLYRKCELVLVHIEYLIRSNLI